MNGEALSQEGSQAQGLRQVDGDGWFLLGPWLAAVEDPAERTGEKAGPEDLICLGRRERVCGWAICGRIDCQSSAPATLVSEWRVLLGVPVRGNP